MAQTEHQNSRYLEKSKFLGPNLIFPSYKNFLHVKFWHVPVRTVDSECVSEITIHNFEKSQKIEICILTYGRKPNNNNL